MTGTQTMAIEARGLTKSFLYTKAVKNVDLNIPVGAVFGLVGQNGAGKSTLLKLVSGIMLPDAGTRSILGQPLKPGETYPRLGALVEEPTVYANMSAFENLMNRALVLGLPNPEEACRQVLSLVGLSEKDAGDARFRLFWPRGGYAPQLSTGMKRRLGVAMALLGNPEVLLLDEPFSGIDPGSAKALRTSITELARTRGATVVVSSHTIAHLERMCTHFGVMRAGRLVRTLTAEELRSKRRSRLMLGVTEPERAVAVLAEELPGLTVTMLSDGLISVATSSGAEPDRRVLSQTLMDARIPITELHATEPDLEAELVQLMGAEKGR